MAVSKFLSRCICVVCVSTVALAGCGGPESVSPRVEPRDAASSYIAVVGAYEPEIYVLREEHLFEHPYSVETIDGTTFYIGELAGADAILFKCGIGLENADNATRVLLDSFNVSRIVFSGIAGGINPDLRLGDVTVNESWGNAVNHPDPETPGFWIDADAAMLTVVDGIADDIELIDSYYYPEYCELGYEPQVTTYGNGVSYDQFVDDLGTRAFLWETYETNTVDMETSAIAEVALERGVPFIAFRCVSDLAGAGNEDDFDTYFALAASNSAIAVLASIEAWTGATGVVESDRWGQ